MALEDEPEKINITNLQTGEGYVMQFNPTQLEREVPVSWQEHQVLGQSFRPLDYLGTENVRLNFELYFRAEDQHDQRAAEEVIRFLESLCYPPATADGVSNRHPPRCLVVWPNTMSFTAVMKNVSIKHEMFDKRGRTIQWTVKIEMNEARKTRLTQEAVRASGPFRSSEQGGD